MMNWIRRLLGANLDREQPKPNQDRARVLATQLRKAKNEADQERSLDALVELGTKEAQKVLLEALHDPSLGTLQGRIVYRLSSLDIALARPALLKCLVDPDWYVSGVAADAIGDMGVKDSVLTGTLLSVLWKASGAKLESLSSGLTPGVYTGAEALEVLNNPASHDRFFIIGIIKALGKLREPTAAQPLKKIIASGEALHSDVLYNAEQALTAIQQAQVD